MNRKEVPSARIVVIGGGIDVALIKAIQERSGDKVVVVSRVPELSVKPALAEPIILARGTLYTPTENREGDNKPFYADIINKKSKNRRR